ncbi:Terpenoid synthase [Cordyceps militaris]|uniref:Terpenoid synthase n=1 Tax=Cordyceps militaris TaxID=73501 RepID=A0A2H4SQ59_CORMI|nr:Terpenoid synthase [Cordyceps militaris]
MATFTYSNPFTQELPTWVANSTSLPIRISKHVEVANVVSQKLVETWKAAGLPTQSGDGEEYLGNASSCHGISLCIPEALPGRIPDAVKLLDLVCVFDDNQDARSCQGDHYSWRAKIAVMKIVASLLIRNPLSVASSVKASIIYLRSLRTSPPVFPAERRSFSDLFPVRLYDFPCAITMPSLAFVLGLELSTKDVAILRCLDIVSTAAMALSNDIMSWPKEMVESLSSKSEPCSAVTIFLKQPGCDQRLALLQCRHKLLQFEMKAALLVDEILANLAISPNAKKMAQSYLLAIAGFAVWQCRGKRNNSKGPVMDLVREVWESPLPPATLNDAFEADLALIIDGYMSIYRKHYSE